MFIRKEKTVSGATAVQIMHNRAHGCRASRALARVATGI